MADFFRASVGCVLINANGHVLALERSPKGSKRWQMAQGGIEPGEQLLDALHREVEEELGLKPKHVRTIAEYPDWLVYELPLDARTKKTGRGQVQKWFLVELLTEDSAIDLTHGASPEFAAWRWTTMNELIEVTWMVRKPVYGALANAFQDHLAR